MGATRGLVTLVSWVPLTLSVWRGPPSRAIGGLLVFLALSALIAGLFTQLARRRRTERESRRNEERCRSVVDAQSELICRFLPDTTLTFVNDAYCRYWGLTRGELLGRRFIELLQPSDVPNLVEHLAQLRSGSASHEHRVVLTDGTIAWHHWSSHAILDPSGQVIELQGVGRDITDRKRAEEALIQLEVRDSAILRAIPDLMFVMLRDGTYVDYHAKDPKQLFVPPSAFLGKRITDVMPSPLAGRFMDAIEQAWQGEAPIVVEYELPLRETRHFEARIVRAGSDRVLSMVRDVTQTIHATELNRELAGRLIASQEVERQRIARELHDDVSQKIALLTLTIDRLAGHDATARSKFSEVHDQVNQIASDVHNLSHELHPSKLETLGLLAAIESLCHDSSDPGALHVIFTHGVVPRAVDPKLTLCMYRIAQEGLHNVVRHSRAREAQVSLTYDGVSLLLQIADSGVGFMSQARHEGLGLVSMRERVSFVGGQLVIHTFPGGGTRIGVRVPFSAQAGGAGNPVSRSA